MKKLSRTFKAACLIILASPLALAWLPSGWPKMDLDMAFAASLHSSFRELAITLGVTVAFVTLITSLLGYASVLSQFFGRAASNVLKAVESVPSILIALFCYAPVSVFLARNSSGASQVASMTVFVLAAALTTLRRRCRGIAIPLGELYHRKYSLLLPVPTA